MLFMDWSVCAHSYLGTTLVPGIRMKNRNLVLASFSADSRQLFITGC